MEDDEMLFAKVGFGWTRHPRVLRIPRALRAAAVYAWLEVLLYTREQELDGWCPLEALDAHPLEALSALETVGLLSRETRDGQDGIVLAKYAEHNETMAQIAERRRLAAERQRKHRAPVTRDSRVSHALVTDSVSGSDLDPDLTRGRDPYSEAAPSLEPCPDWALELALGIAQATGEQLDAKMQWTTFCASGRARVPILWQKWIAQHAVHVRRDKHREQERERVRLSSAKPGPIRQGPQLALGRVERAPGPPLPPEPQKRPRQAIVEPHEAVQHIGGILRALNGGRG